MTASPVTDPANGPTVSVVIPAFNRAASIREAVESVLRQTHADFELLVVDDGSTDGTLEALAGVSDPRLRLLSNPRNMGASAARNTGIRHARGAWVAFQDSDDEWLPQKLEKQMARIAALGPDCVACYCGMAVLGEAGQDGTARTRLRYVPDPSIAGVEGDVLATLLHKSLASTQTLVARRDRLEQCGGFDEQMPALIDWDCAIRLAKLGPFAFVDAPLVVQNFSENSITRHRGRRLTARRRIIEKNLDLLRDRPALLAEHYRDIAGDERRQGHLAEATQSLARALRLTPFDARLWGLSAYVLALRLRRGALSR